VPGEPWAYTFVSMRGRGVADILGGLGLARTAQAVRVPPSAPFWRWLEAYGAEVLAGGGGGLAAVVAAWRFLELLLAGRGVAGDPAAGDLANACAQLLHHRLGEPLAVAGLARHFGVNRSTLFRAFRVAFGMSLATYQQRLRLDHACALLRRTDQSVLAVSRQCGFSDPSYFARAFRKHTGETPQAWRRGGQAD
jgi:AraC-like DNA-binding protein